MISQDFLSSDLEVKGGRSAWPGRGRSEASLRVEDELLDAVDDGVESELGHTVDALLAERRMCWVRRRGLVRRPRYTAAK